MNLNEHETTVTQSEPMPFLLVSPPDTNIIKPEAFTAPLTGVETVSFFTGIGGLDLGVEQSGLKISLANDHWAPSALNYPLNFTGAFNLKDVLEQTGDEILAQLGISRLQLPCVCGGAPCPGWSKMNRKRNEGNASLLDTNLLTFKFVSLLSEIQPLCFVMEQVDGMGDLAVINGFHELKMRFKEELKDYIIQAREVRTLYLGVPQDRTRWIFVGWHRSTGILPQFPKPIQGSLAHLTIAAVAPEVDYLEIRGTRILRKENTEFFSTVPATENAKLVLKDGTVQKMSERPDLLLKIFGYPEDFYIHPDLSFPEIHRLIGNSVPPPLAKAVFTIVAAQLKTLQTKFIL